MRNDIPGVLTEVYSAFVSLLVTIGTCCGAGAAQVQSCIVLGHLSPMLYQIKASRGQSAQCRRVDCCPLPPRTLLPCFSKYSAGLWFPRTPELRCTLRDCGPPKVPHKTSGSIWEDPGVPTLPEAELLIASLMLASWPDWPISACIGCHVSPPLLHEKKVSRASFQFQQRGIGQTAVELQITSDAGISERRGNSDWTTQEKSCAGSELSN
ncbi:hypothetical protein ACLKA7_000959 [Drosophila subpalustris]